MTVYRVAIDQTVTGSPRPVVNTFMVDTTSGQFATAVASSVADAWTAQITAGQCTTVRTDTVRVVSLDGTDYAEEAVGANGGNTEAAVSPQVCLLLKKAAVGMPRKRLGRLFITGLSEAAFDGGGNVAANYLADWTTRGAALLTSLDTQACRMIQPLWFSTVNGQSFETIMEVTGLVPQSRAATQRRRVRG